LIKHVQTRFKLDQPIKGDSSGQTHRQVLEHIRDKTGKVPHELANEEPLPTEAGYLLRWYYQIAPGEALSFAEVKAWAELTKTEIEPFEVETLMEIDRQRRIANFNARQ
jgi:hypothetical protein